MSLHEYNGSVNSTVIQHDEKKSLLTPGQIALITISTVFIFYMTLMFLVCIGEYCKYNKRKKPDVMRRRRHSATLTPGNRDNQDTVRSHAERSMDQSEAFTSDSSSTERPVRAHVPDFSGGIVLAEEMVEVHFEESLDNVNIECVETCDNTAAKLENEIVMLPLIPRQCEDTLDADGDIYCDSPDSKHLYGLEADV